MNTAADIQSTKPRPRRSPAVMMWVRKVHLYSGVLIAPAIVFFAITGGLQVYGLHEANPATGYQPPALLARLGNLHKNQTFAMPRGGPPKAQKPMSGPGAPQGVPAPGKPKPSPGQALLKLFSVLVAAFLVTTSLLGLYMAYAMGRNPWLIGGLLAAGVLVPLIMIAGLGA